MKKFKKNNKGFSLVELIVVIAIMAVLMGVLAPTLIGNIEKSRESKDLQNLDSIRQAVVSAMATEGVYAAVVPASGATNTFGLSGNTLTGGSGTNVINEQFSSIITGDTAMTSSAGKGGTLSVIIKDNGAVEVGVYGSGSAVVVAPRNNVSMVSK